jgi:hypothetical protein
MTRIGFRRAPRAIFGQQPAAQLDPTPTIVWVKQSRAWSRKLAQTADRA